MSDSNVEMQKSSLQMPVAAFLRFGLALVLALCLIGFRLVTVVRLFIAKFQKKIEVERSPTRKPPMHLGDAWQALLHFQSLADQCGAKPFLVSGTLLGIFRNGQLLAHDNDLDMGIFDDDPRLHALLELLRASPLVEAILEKKIGHYERLMNPWMPRLPNDCILYKINIKMQPDAKHVRLDLFVHFSAKGDVAHGSTRSMWMNSAFVLSRIKAADAEFWAPADQRKYLSENYGSDFETPKVNFESSTDCPNCVNVLTIGACWTLASKAAMFRRLGDPMRVRLMHWRAKSFFKSCFIGDVVWKLPG